jgi:anti-sigma B factor antagonist
MAPDSAAAPASGLRLQISPWEDAVIIRCSGHLTVEHSPTLKNHVRNVIPTSKRIIVDLQDVPRMDSSGLGAIVAIYIACKKSGCDFMLINYNQSVKNLLGLTNLLSVFESCAQTGMRMP